VDKAKECINKNIQDHNSKVNIKIFQYIRSHPKTSGFLIAILLSVSVYSMLSIELSDDITKFLPGKNKAVQNYRKVFKNFKIFDKLFFIISMNDTNEIDPDTLIDYGENLVARLYETNGDEIISIRFKMGGSDLKDWVDLYPFYFLKNKIPELEKKISPVEMNRQIEESVRLLTAPGGSIFQPVFLNDPLNIMQLLYDDMSGLQLGTNFHYYNGALFSRDNRYLLIALTPKNNLMDTGSVEKFNSSINQIVNDLDNEWEGVVLNEVYGNMPGYVENAKIIKRDILIVSIFSIITIVLFLFIFFTNKLNILYVLLPVLVGIVVSLGFFAEVFTSMSVMSLAMGTVLIGISVDQGIHLVHHLEMTRSRAKTFKDVFTPLISSGLTTASAFFLYGFCFSRRAKATRVVRGY